MIGKTSIILSLIILTFRRFCVQRNVKPQLDARIQQGHAHYA